MFCPKCGAQNPESSAFCARCGMPIGSAASRPQAPQPQPGTQQYSRQAYTQQGAARMQGAGQAARAYGAQAAAFGSNVATNIEAKKDTIHKILAGIAAAVLIFMPLGWIVFDFGSLASLDSSLAGWGKARMSLPGLADSISSSAVMYGGLGSTAAMAGVSLSDFGMDTSELSSAAHALRFLELLWYLGIIGLVLTVITQLAGIKYRNVIGIVGFGLSSVTSLAVAAGVARAKSALISFYESMAYQAGVGEYAGSYITQLENLLDSMIGISPALWIVLVGSVVGLAFSIFFLVKKSS